MANPTYTIYMRTQDGPGKWPYYKAVINPKNGKIKQGVVWVRGVETKRTGDYYLSDSVGGKQRWILVGSDAIEAQRRRAEAMQGRILPAMQSQQTVPADIAAPEASHGDKHTLQEASDKYFKSLASRDPKTVASYHLGVDPFIANCSKKYVEDIDKQDLLAETERLNKLPRKARLHANPQRTVNNRILNVCLFLGYFGKYRMLKANERQQYHEKKIVAHDDAELSLLYAHADPDEKFLLDFFLGSLVRDSEGHTCKYEYLTGTTLTVRGKQHKTRTVEISPRLADAIRERGERSSSEYLFPNEAGKPNENLLKVLQNLAKRAGAKFHAEMHKLRKTGASRRYQQDRDLPELMLALGHNSLAVTQRYLANVKTEQTKKAIAAADYIPKPRIVRTGTDED
jgi:integrase/recombinase XerD